MLAQFFSPLIYHRAPMRQSDDRHSNEVMMISGTKVMDDHSNKFFQFA
jgi:hypothetical protein